MTRRDVVGRYRGSIMGILWSFMNPLLMLAVYTIVFGMVFKPQWAQINEGNADFALILFVGLIIHALVAECMNRAPGLVIGNVNYVKKVIFPLEVLPWISMGSALFHALVSFAVLLVFYLLMNSIIHWTVILLPLLLLPMILITMGLCWLLASTGVFLRDVAQTTGIITTIMLFLAPVFYPITAIPDRFQNLLYINPLTFIIEQSREILIFGNQPDWQGLMIYTAISLLVAWAGLYWFQRIRGGFADVL